MESPTSGDVTPDVCWHRPQTPVAWTDLMSKTVKDHNKDNNRILNTSRKASPSDLMSEY